jgi:hypothetical protein
MGHSKTFFGLAVLICASGAPVFADSVQVQYTLTGTFSSSVGSAPLSGPNGAYSMNFTLPQMPTPDYFDTGAGDFAIANVPITYSFQCDGCSSATNFTGLVEDVDFAASSVGGMLAIELVTGGHDYFWQLSGAQLFTGSVDAPTLIGCGPCDLVNGGEFELDSNDFVDVGSATLTAQEVATPEPSTLALLLTAAGTFGLLALVKWQRA